MTDTAEDPEGLAAWVERHLLALEVRQYSPLTVKGRRAHLGDFVGWCAERDLTHPLHVTRPIVESYQRHLFYRRKKNGQPLSAKTQHGYLVAVRMFFRWLARRHVVLVNPTHDLEFPRLPVRLPQTTLTPRDVEAFLGHFDTTTAVGLRNRAMMEVFYSTAMRRSELVALDCEDLVWERQVVRIREGKGRVERVVPMGSRAWEYCGEYFHAVRPQLCVDAEVRAFFLSRHGEAFLPASLSVLVHRAFEAAGLRVRGACHLLRHAAATAMLENGADIRFIQELLGHRRLTSTQIYTRVSIQALQAVHAATHPSSGQAAPSRTPSSRTATAAPARSPAELLAELLADDEGDELEPPAH